MTPNEMQLKVSHHPSGRYTLVEKSGTSRSDIMSDDLFGNADKGEFYRAVAAYIAARASEGWSVEYIDTKTDR